MVTNLPIRNKKNIYQAFIKFQMSVKIVSDGY